MKFVRTKGGGFLADNFGLKIGLEGEKEFKKALAEINQNFKVLGSEMKLVSSEFAKNDTSIEALSARNQVLNKEIDAQKEKIKTTKSALDNAANSFGENDRRSKNWQIQLNNAKAALNDLERELKENTEGLKNLDKQMADVEKTSSRFADTLKANLAGDAIFSLTKNLASAVFSLAESFLNLDQATAEYRNNMAKVQSAFQSNNKTAQSAKEVYQSLYAILGDSDQATEAAQFMAELAKSEEDIATWGEIATGVVGTFGDALPIESLMESSNETAKVGTVTGALADALNWAGLSEDEFNERLAQCSSEEERNRLITEALSTTYRSAADAFQENNAQIITARELQAQLDDALGSLANTIGEAKNALLAEFLPAIIDIVNAFNDFLKGTENADQKLQESIESMVSKIIEKLPEFLEFGIKVISAIISGIIQNTPYLIIEILKLIPLMVVEMKAQFSEIINVGSDMVKGLWDGIKSKSLWLKNQVTSWCRSILETVKEFFGIQSPSKLFRDEIGTNMALGIDEGFAQTIKSVAGNMNTALLNTVELNPKYNIAPFNIPPALPSQNINQEMISALINAFSIMNNKAINLTAQLVFPNGEIIAENIFEDLLNISKQRGISLGKT